MFGLALWELLSVDGGSRPFAQLKEPAEIDQLMQKSGHSVPLKWTGAEDREFRVLVEECCSFEQKERPTIDEVVDRLVLLEQNCNQQSGVSLGKCF